MNKTFRDILLQMFFASGFWDVAGTIVGAAHMGIESEQSPLAKWAFQIHPLLFVVVIAGSFFIILGGLELFNRCVKNQKIRDFTFAYVLSFSTVMHIIGGLSWTRWW